MTAAGAVDPTSLLSEDTAYLYSHSNGFDITSSRPEDLGLASSPSEDTASLYSYSDSFDVASPKPGHSRLSSSLSEDTVSRYSCSNSFDVKGSQLGDSRLSSSLSEDTASRYSCSNNFDVKGSQLGDSRLLFSLPEDTVSCSSYSDSFEATSVGAGAGVEQTFSGHSLPISGLPLDATQTSLHSDMSPTSRSYEDSFEEFSELSRSAIRFFPEHGLIKIFPDDLQMVETNEDVDAEATRRIFAENLIEKFRSQQQLTTPAPVGTAHPEIGSISLQAPGDSQLQAFCQQRIRRLTSSLLQQSGKLGKPCDKQDHPQPTSLSEYGLNSAIVDRLRLENLKKQFTKAAKVRVHDVTKCRTCRRHAINLETQAAQRQFYRYHTGRLRLLVIDQQIEDHLTKMTGINQIGDFVRQLPQGKETSRELLDCWYAQARQRQLTATLHHQGRGSSPPPYSTKTKAAHHHPTPRQRQLTTTLQYQDRGSSLLPYSTKTDIMKVNSED